MQSVLQEAASDCDASVYGDCMRGLTWLLFDESWSAGRAEFSSIRSDFNKRAILKFVTSVRSVLAVRIQCNIGEI